MLASALAGAGVGSWLGVMVGMNILDTRLERFKDAINRGELLVIVDVSREQSGEIQSRIAERVPEVGVEGTDAMMPAFP